MRASPKPVVTLQHAPECDVTQWFNTESALSLSALRGNVIVLHAFQMLCPGCVARAIPQAQRVHVDAGDTQYVQCFVHGGAGRTEVDHAQPRLAGCGFEHGLRNQGCRGLELLLQPLHVVDIVGPALRVARIRVACGAAREVAPFRRGVIWRSLRKFMRRTSQAFQNPIRKRNYYRCNHRHRKTNLLLKCNW